MFKKKKNQQEDSIYEFEKSPVSGSSKKSRLKRRKRIHNWIFLGVLAVCVVVFGWVGYVGAYVYPLIWGDLSGTAELEAAEDTGITFGKDQFTVLMMGSDARPGETNSRSDTMMIAYVDMQQKSMRLLSIPRDTYIEIPPEGGNYAGQHTKINHAFAYGGIELSKATLEHNFGIEIDFMAQVDFQGFRDIVDAIGGVTIDVPIRMKYADEGIDLQPGLQTLDGDQALQFCRFRSDGQGDIGRVARQQMFMSALKDQLFSAGTLLRIPDLCTAIKSNVSTNLTGAQLLQIFMNLKDGVDLTTYTPPGEGRYQDGVSYYFIYDSTRDEFFDALNNYEEMPENVMEAMEQSAGKVSVESSSSEGSE